MLLTRKRYVAVLLSMLLLLIASSGFSLVIGPSELSLAQVWSVLFGSEEIGAARDIVLRIRLPRTVLAMLVGASLSVSGVVFQALLRNPLADPFVLGVSGGAALGGIVALTIGRAAGFGYAAVPPAAFAGALLTTALLYLIAGTGNRVSANNLLLTGVVFNAFASAGIVFLASMAGFFEGSRIFLWLIGHLSAVEIDAVGIVAASVLLGLATACVLSRSLNLLALGDERANFGEARVRHVAVHAGRLVLEQLAYNIAP